jgi:hypothetical protein
MKRIFLFVVASYGIMITTTISQPGSTGMAFLKSGAGARSLGMGEAFTAIMHDPAGTFYNPATISTNASSDILFMHRQDVQDTKTEYLAATTGWNDFAFGLSINNTSINDIPLRTQPGDPLGTFNAQNASIGLSTSYSIDSSISVGISGKLLYEKIYVDDASGFGIDIGGWYKTPWQVQFGLAINNIGSMSPLLNEQTRLPLIIRAGTAYQFTPRQFPLEIGLSSDVVSFVHDKKTHINFGIETKYQEMLALRFGYQTGYENKNFSAGIGLSYSILQFDYAFVPYNNNFGTANIFSLEIKF